MRNIAILSLTFLMSSCATTTEFWTKPDVALVPDSVQWKRDGSDYAISGLVQDNAGARVKVKTYASGCTAGYGSLYDRPIIGGMPVMAYTRGATPTDRILNGLCDQAIPEITAYQNRRSGDE
jgi:hypothetical protein